MEPIELEPKYGTREIPGRCIKCLAEKELSDCLMALLREEGEDKELEQRYEALVSFLQSPDSEKLRIEAERYLAEGKRVTLKISTDLEKLRYELKVE